MSWLCDPVRYYNKMHASDLEIEENDIGAQIANLAVGQIILIETISDEAIFPNLDSGEDTFLPPLKLTRAASTYGYDPVPRPTSGRYVVVSDYSYVIQPTYPDEVHSETRGVLIVPLEENDDYSIDQYVPSLVTINERQFYLTHALAFDGTFRDTEVWGPLHVRVTDIYTIS